MVAIWRANRHLKSNYTLPCIFISTKSEISCSSTLLYLLFFSYHSTSQFTFVYYSRTKMGVIDTLSTKQAQKTRLLDFISIHSFQLRHFELLLQCGESSEKLIIYPFDGSLSWIYILRNEARRLHLQLFLDSHSGHYIRFSCPSI